MGRLVADTGSNDALPLLAFTLRELYEECRQEGRMTLEAYERLGGLAGAVGKRADEVVGDQLSPKLESALHDAFLSITKIGEEERVIRRSARLADLPEGTNVLLGRLAAASVGAQVLGVSMNIGLDHVQHPEYYDAEDHLIPEEAAWTWEGAQIRLRAINIARKLGGQAGWGGAVPADRLIVTIWDVFPARAQAEVQNRWIVRVLWSIWFGLVAAAILAVTSVVRAWRRLPSVAPGGPDDGAAVHGP